MKLKQILAMMGISAVTAFGTVWGYGKWLEKENASVQQPGKIPVNYANFFNGNNNNTFVDFTPAATSATPAVVHIKTRTKAKKVTNNIPRQQNPFGDFFGDDFFGDFFNGPRVRVIPEQRASGSGVLITEDGYIVTNNHVVDGADEINVTLTNKKTYKATVIGTDPSSDLAVIKIDGSKNFPYLVYGNSDEVKLGQWVLAIGYPLNLDVTVTAGIVSAKSRSININERQSNTPVESFIQTDAAVNQGNSGGALINSSGELIGINSAIASPTGAYAGYSYAIPVNIVKKIVNDLVKYGAVQRAFVGISYPKENLSDEQLKEIGANPGEKGVYVIDVPKDGAAYSAGIQKGDYITKVNGVVINSGPELQEQIALYKPGDKINLTYKRGNKETTVQVVLKNKVGNTEIVKGESIMEKLGGEFVTIDKNTAAQNDISGGVLVRKIYNGGALSKSKMQEGFVITSVNDEEVKSVDDLEKKLKNSNGTVRIKGIYPGYEGVYGYPLNIGNE